MKKDKKPKTTSQPFVATITLKDGKRKLKLNSPLYFQGVLETLPIGKPLTLWFDLKQPTRSIQQSRFYFLYLGIIASDTGNDVADLHSLFKGKFLSSGVVEVMGEKVRKVKSTTTLSKNDFTEYLMDIENLVGIKIPSTADYNPQHYDTAERLQDYPENNLGETKF